MIRIVSGTCRTSDGLKTSKDGLLSLPEAEEARLVRRGVAKYPDNLVAMPFSDEDGEEPIADMPESGRAAEGEETPVSAPDDLKEMTNAQLRRLAEERGVDCAKLRTKAQLLAALRDGRADGGEKPPELEAGAPVV